ncbi:MAG: HNH endonuclease [Kofleriaceae bacterium]
MFEDHVVETSGNVFAGGTRRSWQEIDRELRAIAKRQRALDAEEAVLLCVVVRREIWRELGKASLLAYLEDVLGYGPKAAKERVRVALALGELPVLADALATGEQSYSAIRELTRVATAKTQAAWCDAARGKNVRQVEELVACHRRGDLPTDPPDLELKPQIVRFEITTATFARLRQAQQVLADEHGGQLDDDALVGALCDAILDGHTGADDGGRARHQILTTVCEACNQAWQHGGGRDLPIGTTDLAIAECDAQRVGSDREPGTAVQDVTPKVRRFVTLRDRKRCTVPGCRAARHIDVHHIVPRHLGGTHEAENITLLCAGHHRALHQSRLMITGRAPSLSFAWPNGAPALDVDEVSMDTPDACRTDSKPHVGPAEGPNDGRTDLRPEVGAATSSSNSVEPPRPSNYEWTVKKTEAMLAIKQLGFSMQEARAFVEQAAERRPRSVLLEALVVDALRISRHAPRAIMTVRPPCK